MRTLAVILLSIGTALAAAPRDAEPQRPAMIWSHGCTSGEKYDCRQYCEMAASPGWIVDGVACVHGHDADWASVPACGATDEPTVLAPRVIGFALAPVFDIVPKSRTCRTESICLCRQLDCRVDWSTGIPLRDPRCPRVA